MVLLLIACSGRPAPSAPEPEPSATATLVESRSAEERAGTEAPETAAVEVPPEVAAIRSLLMAHHTEDLPTKEALLAHEDPAGALRWLADHDELVVVRARAEELLLLFEEPVGAPE